MYFGKNSNQSYNLFGGNNTSLFGQQTGQKSITLFGGQPTEQKNNTLFGGQPTEQKNNTLFGTQNTSNPFLTQNTGQKQINTLFGVQNTEQKLTNIESDTKNNNYVEQLRMNDQKIDKLLQQNEILNSNINELLKKNTSEKELCVVCPLHEHPLVETTCNKVNIIHYNNGFSCDICKIEFNDKNTMMYHCKNCMDNGKLFDVCEKCIRKCLKVI